MKAFRVHDIITHIHTHNTHARTHAHTHTHHHYFYAHPMPENGGGGGGERNRCGFTLLSYLVYLAWHSVMRLCPPHHLSHHDASCEISRSVAEADDEQTAFVAGDRDKALLVITVVPRVLAWNIVSRWSPGRFPVFALDVTRCVICKE
jgi:hypothetical protein